MNNLVIDYYSQIERTPTY